ncbi:MAG TPA: xylan 1,4-beta-xylosidase, partial [Cellulomonadaceae bacterium]|nr:xylan 1,4-beta-xylosidase [Cellulomonadaceae bacterium]
VCTDARSSHEQKAIPFATSEFRPQQDPLDLFDGSRSCLDGTRLAGVLVRITDVNTSCRPDKPIHGMAYLATGLAAGSDLVDSFSYWPVCDVFAETNVPASISHGDFGLLTRRQIANPTYHLYAFMVRMGAQVLARDEDQLV